MVIVTVAGVDTSPVTVSFASYVNESVPRKPLFGVYVNDPSGFSARLPLEGPDTSTAFIASEFGAESFASTP
jgi:hypothetical protein